LLITDYFPTVPYSLIFRAFVFSPFRVVVINAVPVDCTAPEALTFSCRTLDSPEGYMGQGTALYLAPIPKKLSHRQGFFSLGGSPMRYIKIEANDPQSLVPAAKKTGLNWQITLSPF